MLCRMMRGKIIISDSGEVGMPTCRVLMSDNEIALLLGVMLPTVRGAIKRLMDSRAVVDCSGGVVRGSRIVPEYFGLEVVIAVAFQLDSYKAEIFRKWVLRRLTQPLRPIYINIDNPQNETLN